MIFSYNEGLEDKIIRLLSVGDYTAKELLDYINKEQNDDYTIQALYLAVKALLKNENVYKKGLKYSLNEEWKDKVVLAFKQPQKTEILEGEKFIYVLSSLSHYDVHWKNVVLPLHKKYNIDPIFFYNYHYIWVHLGETRKRSELEYYKSFAKEKKFAFSLVGSHSPLEIETKKLIESEYVRIYIDNIPLKKSGYITIFNDYVITTQLSQKTIQEVEICYKNSKTINELEQQLQKIDFQTKKVKLIIERNKEKAKKLRKKLSKDFYIPKELREKFDLF